MGRARLSLLHLVTLYGYQLNFGVNWIFSSIKGLEIQVILLMLYFEPCKEISNKKN
jgi:hypothetical protein